VDKAEARQVAAARIAELRSVPFPELSRRLADAVETDEVVGPSGVSHQLAIQGLWDDKDEANLRVIVSVDDGGLRAMAPISDDFIIARDGSFVGE
jgi:hypothetical protein